MAEAKKRRPPASGKQGVDAIFVREKGGADIGIGKSGNGMKLMLWVPRDGLPTAARVARPTARQTNRCCRPLRRGALPEALLGERA